MLRALLAALRFSMRAFAAHPADGNMMRKTTFALTIIRDKLNN